MWLKKYEYKHLQLTNFSNITVLRVSCLETASETHDDMIHQKLL